MSKKKKNQVPKLNWIRLSAKLHSLIDFLMQFLFLILSVLLVPTNTFVMWYKEGRAYVNLGYLVLPGGRAHTGVWLGSRWHLWVEAALCQVAWLAEYSAPVGLSQGPRALNVQHNCMWWPSGHRTQFAEMPVLQGCYGFCYLWERGSRTMSQPAAPRKHHLRLGLVPLCWFPEFRRLGIPI